MGTGEATYRYLDKPQLCSEVERGIAIVCEVRVLQALWAVLDYSFEECKVFEMDSPADAKGDFNPEQGQLDRGVGYVIEVYLHIPHGYCTFIVEGMPLRGCIVHPSYDGYVVNSRCMST